MKIFISWSGDISHKVALSIKGWLENVIQSISVFVSSEDIEKGQRWFPEISTHLQDINFGILCLTPENLSAPWVLFEAGALSKTLGKSLVCPLLIGLTNSDLKGPLSQFMTTSLERKDIFSLLKTINNQLAGQKIEDSKLEKAFDKWWPDLEKELKDALEQQKAGTAKAIVKKRDQGDILEEILTLTRSMSQRLNAPMPSLGHSSGPSGRGLVVPTFSTENSLDPSRLETVAGNLSFIESMMELKKKWEKAEQKKADPPKNPSEPSR